MLDQAQQALSRSIGVTRVARVSGLDRSGVEVACAVRPGGHVLQVCNGKGRTFAEAAWSALGEAAELCAAEKSPDEAVHASLAGLRREHRAAWGPDDLGEETPLFHEGVQLAWTRATDLFGGPEVLVPAQAVRCPPPGAAPLGPALVRWTSNGMGAHPEAEPALLHALLEAVERDQLARALPEGFNERALRARLLDGSSLAEVAPRSAALVAALRDRGLDAHLLDLSPGGARDLGLPVAGALLVDGEAGPIPIAAGYACRLDLDGALEAALLEACQSRLTDVHGAREDVAEMAAADVEGLRAAIARVRRRRPAKARAAVAIEDGVAVVLRALRTHGFERAAFVELGRPWLALHVVKVMVPGLLLSELL